MFLDVKKSVLLRVLSPTSNTKSVYKLGLGIPSSRNYNSLSGWKLGAWQCLETDFVLV